jgi:hypothetical protein
MARIFVLPACRSTFWQWAYSPSRECISVGVLPPLTVFGCKFALLETLHPAGCLSFEVLDTITRSGRSGRCAGGTLVRRNICGCVQCLNKSQWFLSGHAVVSCWRKPLLVPGNPVFVTVPTLLASVLTMNFFWPRVF